MAFEVPSEKKSKGQDKFEFTIEGETFSVRKAKFLTLGQAEALEAGDSTSAMLDLFGERGTAAGDAVRGLTTEQFGALVEAWQKDSGIETGESSAS